MAHHIRTPILIQEKVFDFDFKDFFGLLGES